MCSVVGVFQDNLFNLFVSVDLHEAQIAGSDKGNDLVVPLLMQNKPSVVKGKEKGELADVDLRPEQVTAFQLSIM